MGIKFEFFQKIGRTAPNLLKIVKESPYKYKGNIAISVLCNLYGGGGLRAGYGIFAFTVSFFLQSI